jgi:hypothetical protein
LRGQGKAYLLRRREPPHYGRRRFNIMALMDMPDQARVLREIHRVLRPGAFLQLSILHPCFVRRTARSWARLTVARAIEIGDYFEVTDGRVDTWWFETVAAERRSAVAPFRTPRFHRTLGEWVAMICRAGLVIERFGEPCTSPELAG